MEGFKFNNPKNNKFFTSHKKNNICMEGMIFIEWFVPVP